MTPRRLKPQQRREELLDTGAALFATKPYKDVPVEEIVARAGVSRATLYHYYPSKYDLYVAILKRASERSLARVDHDPQLSLAEQLAAGLQAHIQSLVDHPFEAVAITRGALSDDAEIQAIIADELSVVGQLLTDQLVAGGCLRDATEIAVEGWLAFVRTACLKWIQSQNISRADLTKMCLCAFDYALDIPTPTSSLLARMCGVTQSQGITSPIRTSERATSARPAGAPSVVAQHGALRNARSLYANGED